jgi:hypothetical protein
LAATGLVAAGLPVADFPLLDFPVVERPPFFPLTAMALPPGDTAKQEDRGKEIKA